MIAEFEYEFPNDLGLKMILCQCKEFGYINNEWDMIDFKFTVYDDMGNVVRIKYDKEIFDEIEKTAYYFLIADQYYQGLD